MSTITSAARSRGIAVTAVGIALLGLAWWAWQTQAQQSSAAEVSSGLADGTAATYTDKFSSPARILVSRLGVDVAITPGVYDAAANSWNVSFSSAQFATISTPPNAERGTTILYAHNTRRLFGPLAQLTVGDEAEVVTASGRIFTYRYTGDTVVDPTNTEIFDDTSVAPARLVLITCSGSWNQYRELHAFSLVNVGV